jgi:predicted RNA-binding Zn ribbon-like protein
MNEDTPGGFPLVGEPLALDLINTRVHGPQGDVDLLATPAALRAWLETQSDRLPPPDRALDNADLAAVHALRDAVAAVVGSIREGTPPDAPALAVLTEAQRVAPVYRAVEWDGRAVTATTRRTGDYAARLVADLAAAATDLLTSREITNVRQCDGRGCRLLFLPEHPRRRWCSPALCGNRERVARYYRRHRQSSPSGSGGDVVDTSEEA